MLSTQPYKGTRDFYPQDLRIRNYMFNVWRKCCLKFGYEEYDGPLLEPFELFAAKTGEEIINEQLYFFEDKGGRKVAIRPEMTPTVSRMAAQKILNQSPTPLKWFSIANFYRYEKPQKGRLREFFQLNADIFGEEGVWADLDLLLLNKAIMEAFGAKDTMYEVRLNNRFLINYLFEQVVGVSGEKTKDLAKALDKRSKLSEADFGKVLEKLELDATQIKNVGKIAKFTIADVKRLKDLPEGANDLVNLLELAENAGLKNVVYDPLIVRGFDYYDGNVFEQFDLTPGNNRSMFGGGRYNGLISLFIKKNVPAVGFAPGDVTMLDFLESWKLLPAFESETQILVTLFPENSECYIKAMEAAQELRQWINVETYLYPNEDLTKQIKYADRKGIPYVLILGPEELKNGTITLKSLKTGEQEEFKSLIDLWKKTFQK